MIKRTVEISTPGCYVHMKHEQLVIEKDGFRMGSVPFEDLGFRRDRRFAAPPLYLRKSSAFPKGWRDQPRLRRRVGESEQRHSG